MSPILQVHDLHVHYRTERGPAKAVNGVSFDLAANTRLGLVGESGSGKSTLALALLRLLKPPGYIERGQVLLDGVDVAILSDQAVRQLRLSQVSLIPQGAMNALNPVTRIGKQIIDGIRAHDQTMSSKDLQKRVQEVLAWVDLEPDVAKMYPHELSGGMKQRVCIAIAISLRPKLIIADEPTSALDVVVQKQVMETIARLQEALGAAVILIGHDMGLMVQFVDQLIVMYAGKVAEAGPIQDIFSQPRHPYTQSLIASLPTLAGQGELQGIPGVAPSLLDVPPGCLFNPRCSQVMDICAQQSPPLYSLETGQEVACHLYAPQKV